MQVEGKEEIKLLRYIRNNNKYKFLQNSRCINVDGGNITKVVLNEISENAQWRTLEDRKDTFFLILDVLETFAKLSLKLLFN